MFFNSKAWQKGEDGRKKGKGWKGGENEKENIARDELFVNY